MSQVDLISLPMRVDDVVGVSLYSRVSSNTSYQSLVLLGVDARVECLSLCS